MLVLLALAPLAAYAASRIQPVPVPGEMRSAAFTVKVNGQPVDVAHAASRYEWVSFDGAGPAAIEITATEPGFWDKGVDIHPWRLGIRPTRQGQTIRFRLDGQAKLSIARPGDFLNQAQMLFLFYGAPPPAPPPAGPNVQVIPPGIHRGSLNPKSGDTIYLAPGSFVFGSLNLWKVENVKVLGRGTIVYQGNQDPNADEGWMQRPDWHCIGALESRNVEVDGLTCIVRARTWSIQMKDSGAFLFDDIRVVGGNPGNANQDGMDWLGGGDTTVRNAFIRASDDVFSMAGNWDGYKPEDIARPGHDVQNIVIENSVLSTSISNVVRLGWPGKIFNSRNFVLRGSDILHGGIGACGQAFALLGVWGANGARGAHSDVRFENLFLDNWYSLVQLEQEQPLLQGFVFRNIWALDQPPLADSTLTGQVKDVAFENVTYGQKKAAANADLPLEVTDGAEPARFDKTSAPLAEFAWGPQVFWPGQNVTFTARNLPGGKYTWRFGDGAVAHGRRVRHKFPDAEGTELDGSGRFRVLLEVEDPPGRQDWAAQAVVAIAGWHEALRDGGALAQGLNWTIYPGTWTELPDLSKEAAILSGESRGIYSDPHGFTHYATAWDGMIDVPVDGGYTFYTLARDGARLLIDGVTVAKTGPPFPQVCGAPGNAMRYARGAISLRAGRHTFHLEGLHSQSRGVPRVLWEGPGVPLSDVPAGAFSHALQGGLGPVGSTAGRR